MILVDTSVWIDHFRRTNPQLVELLDTNAVLMHPMVSGELACGNLRNRREILLLLQRLPTVVNATDAEVLALLSTHHLYGVGIGWIDAHLLTAARIDGVGLWTKDTALIRAQQKLRIRDRL